MQLQAKVLELQNADEKDLPRLTRELQRLRVSMMLLREVVSDVADPTTYRELTLLNKMVTGTDIEADAKSRADDEAEAEAADRLSEVGVRPEDAHSLVRVLESLRQAMNARHAEPTIQ